MNLGGNSRFSGVIPLLHRTKRALATGLCVLLFISSAQGAGSSRDEYLIKAMITAQIIFYTRWPDSSESSVGHRPVRRNLRQPESGRNRGTKPRHKPAVLCVVGYYPFQNFFDQKRIVMRAGKAGLIVRKLNYEQSFKDCNVIFLSREEHRRQKALLARASQYPILTVGETTDFLEDGGHIRLFLAKARVGFDVNLRSARRQKLFLSSKMLGVAARVIGIDTESKLALPAPDSSRKAYRPEPQ